MEQLIQYLDIVLIEKLTKKCDVEISLKRMPRR